MHSVNVSVAVPTMPTHLMPQQTWAWVGGGGYWGEAQLVFCLGWERGSGILPGLCDGREEALIKAALSCNHELSQHSSFHLSGKSLVC